MPKTNVNGKLRNMTPEEQADFDLYVARKTEKKAAAEEKQRVSEKRQDAIERLIQKEMVAMDKEAGK